MSPPNWMAYALVGGVAVVALIVPLIIGGDGWYVPLVVLPFAVLYLLFDRRMRRRQEQPGD